MKKVAGKPWNTSGIMNKQRQFWKSQVIQKKLVMYIQMVKNGRNNIRCQILKQCNGSDL